MLVNNAGHGYYGAFEVVASDGTLVLVSYSYDLEPNPLEELPPGLHTVRVRIPPRTLGPGDYLLQFSLARGQKGTVVVDEPGVIARFSLDDLTTIKGNRRLGYFSTILDWDVQPAREPAGRPR